MESKQDMKAPYGLRIIESWLACPLVKYRFFCDIPKNVIASLDEVSSVATYPR